MSDREMRVLIRHMLTNMYYSEGGRWTQNPDEAAPFQSTVSALRMIERAKMEDAEVVLKFDDSTYDVRLPNIRRSSGSNPPSPESLS